MLNQINISNWNNLVKVWITGHYLEFLLLVGIAAGIALIAIISIGLFITRPKYKPEKMDSFPMKTKRKKLTIFFFILFLGSLLFVSTVFSSGMLTNTTSCVSCHEKAIGRGWKRFSHRNIACRSCHIESGPVGYMQGQISVAAKYLSKYTGYKIFLVWSVDNSSCIACHRQEPKNPVMIESLSMSHKEIADRGLSCLNCHVETKHTQKQR